MLLDAENTKVDNTEKVSPLLVSHSGGGRWAVNAWMCSVSGSVEGYRERWSA